MRKNIASQVIGAQMVSASDGSAFTGSVTCSVTIDGGTQATGSVGSGACTHEGNGYHTYAPAQAETNGNLLAFTFTGSGAVPVTVQVFTVGYDPTAAQLPANVTQFGGSNGTFASGRPEVNTTHIAGSAVSTSSAQLGVNVVNAGGTAWATVITNLVASIWSATTRLLTAGTNIVLAKGTGVTGFNDLDAAGVRDAVGLASANLDTQLSTIDMVVDGVKAVTDALPNAGALTDLSADAAAAKEAAEASEDALVELTEDSGGLRFTEKALEEAPAGGGGATPEQIAEAVWDEDLTGHTTPDSAGYVLGNVATGTPPSASAIADEVQTRTIAAVTTVGSVSGNVGGNVTGSVGSLAAQAKADVNAEVDAALSDYDPPTKAELDSAVAPLATATALSDVAGDAADAKAASEGAEDVLADLTEVSGADLRFTAVALEEAPTGGSVDPGAIAEAVLEESVAAHAGTAGSLAAVLTDIETDAAAAADPETLLDATSAVESGVTVRGSLRLMLAALAGKLSGAATTTVTIRNVGDSKNRITATVDESGNRTAVTTDAS